MRRLSALWVLVLLLAAYAIPAWAGVSVSTPICCRASGKHHCGMDAPSEDTSLRDPSRCPYRLPSTAPANQNHFSTPLHRNISHEMLIAFVQVSSAFELRQAPVFTFYDRRGPPTSSF